MIDDPVESGWRSRCIVSVENPTAVHFWAKAMQVTEQDILLASASVGNKVVDISKALGKPVS